MNLRNNIRILILLLILPLFLTGCAIDIEITNEVNTLENVIEVKNEVETEANENNKIEEEGPFLVPTMQLNNIPAYDKSPYVVINNNEPFFNTNDFTKESFEQYSELDSLGRCGVAFSNIGKDLMPTEERGNIGSVKPSGWQTAKYDGIDGNYLYNRCHLIGFQLTGENANNKNLITGTRYMNVQGMLPFENMVADYIKETNNHVLFRVTPIFKEDNLLASGVLMEAYSVEDNGEGVKFCVYCYNVQPGIEINYSNGESTGPEFTGNKSNSQNVSAGTTKPETNETIETVSVTYVLNTSSKKIHYPDCSSVSTIKETNKENFSGSINDLISQGYTSCGSCKP